MPSYTYIIDDISHVPSGYTSTEISPQEAEQLLRGRPHIFWWVEDKDGDTDAQLRELLRHSQTGIGFGVDKFLEQCKVTNPEEMRVGGPHTYLLLRSNQDPEVFTPTT